MIFMTLDLGKSEDSELFGPHFWRQIFFLRRAPGVLWGPHRGPLGLCPMSTPPESLHMDKIIQEKNIEPVSFQNWHRQNNLNLRHTPFLHQNRYNKKILKFFFQKSVFHGSGSRRIRGFWVVWTPLLETKFFSAKGLWGTLGPPQGPPRGLSDEHSPWFSSDGL